MKLPSGERIKRERDGENERDGLRPENDKDEKNQERGTKRLENEKKDPKYTWYYNGSVSGLIVWTRKNTLCCVPDSVGGRNFLVETSILKVLQVHNCKRKQTRLG